MIKQFLLVGLVCLSFVTALPSQTPIIGIFTLPDDSDQPKLGQLYHPLKAGNFTYIAASYVKYLQMSGAQVVPIFAFSNTTVLDNLLSKINGVLFTGGSQAIDINNKWTKSADYIVKYAINENKKGNVFPVWGTCLGWQLLSYLTSGYDSKCLSSVRGESGVKNTISILSNSYLYDGLSSALRNKLQNGKGIVYFNHIYAVSTAYFNTNQKLKAFWHLISTTKSSYNQEFVSTAEGIDYPFFGIQFHPEKNLYEWKVYADRSDSGAEITQILSNKFVQKARKSTHRFPNDEDLRKSVIYNYRTQLTTMSFTEIYLFPEVHEGDQQKKTETANLLTQ